MSVIVIVLLCAAPLSTLSQDSCPAGCAVCCKFYCCQSGQSCCDGTCRDSCQQDKTAVWIIVGIVVAIVVALISVCLIIACIYCCSQTSQRHGTAVRSIRHPPHVRRAYAGTNSRSPRPQYELTQSSQDSPRIWSMSNPSHNLRFSRHSPAFVPPPPGFVVPGGSSGPPRALPPAAVGFPNSPRALRSIPTAPLPKDDDDSGRKSSPANRKEPGNPGVKKEEDDDDEVEDVTVPYEQSSSNPSKFVSLEVVQSSGGKSSGKAVFTKSPKVSTAGLATQSSRSGAKISAVSVDLRSPRQIEVTSLDSDDDNDDVYPGRDEDKTEEAEASRKAQKNVSISGQID